jgi:hypothetical protein
MKNQSQQTSGYSNSTLSGNLTSVYQLVSKLQCSLLPQTTGKKSFILNNVDQSLSVFAEENALSYVIGSLLSTAVDGSADSCIRVETIATGNQVQIRIRNNNAGSYGSFMNIPVSFIAAARQLGGHISLETGEGNGMTVVFSLGGYTA